MELPTIFKVPVLEMAVWGWLFLNALLVVLLAALAVARRHDPVP